MTTAKRILVIDDEQNLRASLGLVLKRAGYVPYLAGSAAEGIDMLQKNGPFDLVFLDLHMPGAGGLELLPTLTRSFPNMPVVILTGNSNLESLQEAQSWGIRGYLLKPVNPWEIIERAGRIIDEEQLHKKRGRILRDLQGLLPELRGEETTKSPAGAGI